MSPNFLKSFTVTLTGGVKAVRIPKEKGTEKGKGFAYIEFNSHISHRVSNNITSHSMTKANKMACAPSEDSDHPGHPCSLAESSLCTQMGSLIYKDPRFLDADSED